jgi:YidC/Oxa1 family membrane protein insertase
MADKSRNQPCCSTKADRVYVAQTGLIGGAFPTHKTPMAPCPASGS